MKALAASLLAASLALAPIGCSRDEDPPKATDAAAPVDGAGPQLEGGGAVETGTPPGDGGGQLASLASAACEKLIASCQGEMDPLGQAWKTHISPWSQQACEAIPLCYEAQTTTKCIERLYGYYICLGKTEPFSCQACLNQYQYVMGACPCIRECDPACP